MWAKTECDVFKVDKMNERTSGWMHAEHGPLGSCVIWSKNNCECFAQAMCVYVCVHISL